jgi:hypothetical protein
MSFGATKVFSRDVLSSEAILAWLVLFLVPVIFCVVVLGLEPDWLRTQARNAEPLHGLESQEGAPRTVTE